MPTTKTTIVRRITIVRGITIVGLVTTLATGLGACGASVAKSESTTSARATTLAPTSTSTSTTSTAPAPTSRDAGTSGNSGGNATASGGGTGTNPNGGSMGSGASSTSQPTITSFTTPDDIDCHNGNLQEFTLTWATERASKVTISIDGPGIYDTYGPSGSASLPFNCSTPHSFLLTAYAADGTTTATKSVTLQPRNAQASDSANSGMSNG